MVAVKNLLLFITAASALTIGRRSVTTITNDITKIDNDVVALTSAINNYNGGGILAAIPVQQAESTLENDISSATKDAQAETQFSSADSTTVINLVNSKLAPDVNDSLNALVKKKAKFAADGLTSNIQSDLASLKTKTDAFGNALTAIASADQKSAAQASLATIDGYFNAAIAQFNN